MKITKELLNVLFAGLQSHVYEESRHLLDDIQTAAYEYAGDQYEYGKESRGDDYHDRVRELAAANDDLEWHRGEITKVRNELTDARATIARLEVANDPNPVTVNFWVSDGTTQGVKITAAANREILNYLEAGKIIQAIKVLRAVTGKPLLESKKTVDTSHRPFVEALARGRNQYAAPVKNNSPTASPC